MIRTVDRQRSLQRLKQSSRDVRGVFGRTHILEHRSELIATGSRQGVAVANAGGQSLSHFLQVKIPYAMSEAVIDLFETVEIDGENRHHALAATATCERLVQAVLQEDAVGK